MPQKSELRDIKRRQPCIGGKPDKQGVPAFQAPPGCFKNSQRADTCNKEMKAMRKSLISSSHLAKHQHIVLGCGVEQLLGGAVPAAWVGPMEWGLGHRNRVINSVICGGCQLSGRALRK